MIINAKIVKNFEKNFLIKEDIPVQKKLEILSALYEQAKLLGHFTEKDILDGIENDIELARKLNVNVSINSH